MPTTTTTGYLLKSDLTWDKLSTDDFNVVKARVQAGTAMNLGEVASGEKVYAVFDVTLQSVLLDLAVVAAKTWTARVWKLVNGHWEQVGDVPGAAEYLTQKTVVVGSQTLTVKLYLEQVPSGDFIYAEEVESSP